MKNKPGDIYQLLREAMTSQVEMGMGELIINRKNVTKTNKPVYKTQPAPAPSQAGSVATEPAQPVIGSTMQYESLETHRQAICECQLCPLGATRNKFVYGVGNINADLMFIGEAPGADEDRLGEPFVGRAGQLLDRILAAIQFTRSDIYIANILKCRPPGNRDPQPEEEDKCMPYLLEQIRLIQPKLICALGRIAAQRLLKTTTPLGKLRGTFHEFHGIPMLVTYHPAALLRFQAYKRDTWEDMQLLKARYDSLK